MQPFIKHTSFVCKSNCPSWQQGTLDGYIHVDEQLVLKTIRPENTFCNQMIVNPTELVQLQCSHISIRSQVGLSQTRSVKQKLKVLQTVQSKHKGFK